MKNNKGLIAGLLVIVILFGMLFTGCATTFHQVEIANVQNIREIYIKNAGTSNWGTNMVRDLKNIDKSRYSNRVDVRVIDANGLVYSKLNIPFNDAAFTMTDQSFSPNIFFILTLLSGFVLIISAL